MAAILGIGVVSPVGLGAEALARAVRGEVQPTIETQEFNFALEGATVLRIARADPTALENYLPKRKLRRVDRFSRMALLAAYQAVEDAGIEFIDRSRVGVVLGTGYGPTATTFAFQDGLIDDGDKCASPTYFANSVHNVITSQVSIQLGLTGPCQTITCFGETTPNVLLTAQLWLERGMVDYVLAGVGDEHCAVRSAAAAKERLRRRKMHEAGNEERCLIADETLPLGEGFVAWLMGLDNAPERFARLDVVTENPEIKKADEICAGLAGVLESANDDVHRPPPLPERDDWITLEPLLGTLPVSSGFDVALAAWALKHGAFPQTDGAERPLPEGAKIGCLRRESERTSRLLRIRR